MDFLLEGPMKDKLPNGGPMAPLKRNCLLQVWTCRMVFICTTSQSERLRQMSIDDDKVLGVCGKRLGRVLVNQQARIPPEN
eukprot:1185316-Prorocentrum_lima.AAC.1